jgi:recombination protein RecA
MDIHELKKMFASHLCEVDRLKTPEGLATGLTELDIFLLGGGIPKGALSLFNGALGTGGTSLWIGSASQVLTAGRWVAWVNYDGLLSAPLSPLPLEQHGLSLERFVTCEVSSFSPHHTASPTNRGEQEKRIVWLLQELMASSLFDLIGCDLGELYLKDHLLRKLQAQARDAHVALVFLSQRKTAMRGTSAALFSLILKFEKKQILIERALHRPTPHRLARSVSYDRFTLHTSDRIVTGTPLLDSDHAHRERSARANTGSET